jgi:hypothetical protein
MPPMRPQMHFMKVTAALDRSRPVLRNFVRLDAQTDKKRRARGDNWGARVPKAAACRRRTGASSRADRTGEVLLSDVRCCRRVSYLSWLGAALRAKYYLALISLLCQSR